MKNWVWLLLVITVGCVEPGKEVSTEQDESVATLTDSCEQAQKYEMVVKAEAEQAFKTSDPQYTGEYTTYRDDNKYRKDMVHTFEQGNLIKSVLYYPNGELQEEYSYRCQSIHGVVKFYHQNGKIEQQIPYRFGRRNGTAIRFDSTGREIDRITFRNNGIVADTLN